MGTREQENRQQEIKKNKDTRNIMARRYGNKEQQETRRQENKKTNKETGKEKTKKLGDEEMRKSGIREQENMETRKH